MEAVLIQAPSIRSAWEQLICKILEKGEIHQPDYKTKTTRVHATLHIEDVHKNQISPFVPFGDNLIKKYKEELTEQYAEWYVSLPDDDKRKFDYCYAKQLFLYGQGHFNSLRENIQQLRPGSRRHVGVLWENEVHVQKYEDQPCWIAYKLEQINDTELQLYILYRSWDAYGGVPANLPAIIYGIEKILEEENSPLRIKSLFATGWDTHIYESDKKAAEKVIKNNKFCPVCHELQPKHSLIPTPKGPICTECKKQL